MHVREPACAGSLRSVYARVEDKAFWLSFSIASFLIFFSVRFSHRTWSWPASSRDLSLSTGSSGVKAYASTLRFYVGAVNLNSYPPSCVASTSRPKPSPLPSFRIVNV